MSKVYFGGKGRPFVKANVGVIGGLTPGNWVVTDGHTKKSRVAGYDTNGNAVLVPPRGKGRRARVSMDAFRLAVGRNRSEVFGSTRINTNSLTLDTLLANFI